MSSIAKWIIGLFAIALIGWLGFLGYGVQSSRHTTSDQAAGSVFQSKLINLQFTPPAGSFYTEEDTLADFEGKTGHKIYFQDTSQQSVAFAAVTSDFKISDSVPHDLLPGVETFDASTNLSVAVSHELGSQVQSKTLELGMHLVGGYNAIEGTVSFPVYLLVEPPRDSGLKYLSFYLGDSTDQLTESDQTTDSQGLTYPTAAGIERVIGLGLNEQLPLIKDKLAQAIIIAQTFQRTQYGAKASAAGDETSAAVAMRQYSNDQIGISFDYPKQWQEATSDLNLPDWIRNSQRTRFYLPSTTQDYPSHDFPLDGLLDILVLENPDEKPLKEFFSELKQSNYESCLAAEAASEGGIGCPEPEDVSGWQELSVRGKSAIRSGERGVPEGSPTDELYINLGTKIIGLRATNYHLKDDKQFDILDTILRTLQVEL